MQKTVKKKQSIRFRLSCPSVNPGCRD